VLARPALGQQQPKSILKKSTDDGNSGTAREVARVKFMLDGADGGKLEPPAPAANVGGNGADSSVKAAKSVGFASSQPLQPPPRALLQPPMRPALQQQQQAPRAAAVTQQLPLPPPLSLQQHLPYHQPRVADGPPLVPPQGQLLAYPPRGHGEGPSALPGPPLPYQPRPTGFPGGQLLLQQQQVGYPPRSGDSPPLVAGQQQQQQFPPRPSNANTAAEEVPMWKRGEKEFKEEVWRLMTGIAKMVEPLTDKNGFFPYHLFRAQ